MRPLLLFFGIVTLLYSCSSDKSKSIIDKLNGTWILDSISTPSDIYQETIDANFFIFRNTVDYSYEYWNGNVGNTSNGKFFILDNPKRGLMTLTCIPDILVSEKETIRLEYINLDILSIQENRLVLIDETKWLDRDSLPSVQFEKVYIYKKKK